MAYKIFLKAYERNSKCQEGVKWEKYGLERKEKKVGEEFINWEKQVWAVKKEYATVSKAFTDGFPTASNLPWAVKRSCPIFTLTS